MITMLDLHRAGAEIGRPHGEAWARLPAGQRDPSGLLATVSDLHQRLGRRILPGDLTGHPLPVVAGGSIPPVPRYGSTPGSVERSGIRALTASEVASLRQAVQEAGVAAVASRCGVGDFTIREALRGRRLMPATRRRMGLP